jgi:threonyl-tRNA synthetase
MSQKENNQLSAKRHSLAHLLAASVKELYPGAKNAIGPAIENGFYQDFDMGKHKLSDGDLEKIENKMRELVKGWGPFEHKEVSLEQAKKDFADNPYKLQLIAEFAGQGKTITENNPGGFLDLCKGGHADDLSKIDPKSFKLSHLAGAYWRGDSDNQMLTRIYGLAFETKDQLADYLKMQEEAKKRDHRKLGKELDLFLFSDLVGSGLPLYTPRGNVVREGLIGFSEEVRAKLGFQRVWTPHITKKELYETSGHWAKFGNELFLVKSQETSDELVMKPMNCPHHAQIYASQARSYKDLPIKYMETATCYRDEKSGELHGLSRVRSLTQDDSHTYCRAEQADEIFSSLIEAVQFFYKAINMDLEIRLSFRDDSDQYLGDKKLWEFGQKKIEEIAKKNELSYYIEEGEAAFYGPKIDFMAIDAIGRKWQVATIQFDFVQPERFKLEYTDESGNKQQPIMVHCAIMGSFDRFFSVYIEHTAGKFPIWLAPEQIRLVTVNQEPSTLEFAKKLIDKARELDLRVTVDNSNESVGKKIRSAEMMKVPYTLVIGEKEIENGQLSPRIRQDISVKTEHDAVSVDEFLGTVANETKSRATKTSL